MADFEVKPALCGTPAFCGPLPVTDLVRYVSDERFIDMEQSPFCLYVFAFIKLVCVHSVTQPMNTSFVTFVL